MLKATDDVNDHLNTETISFLKKIPKYIYFIFIVALLFLLYLPNEIVLKGKIEADTRYSIEVEYKAQRNGFFCASGNFLNRPIFGSSSRKFEYIDYFPTIKENNHYLSIPTSKFSFALCDYAIDSIKMNFKNNKILLFEQKSKLIYVNKRREIKLIKVEKNNYTLDIGSVNNSDLKKETILITERIKKKKALWKNYIVFLEVFFILCIFFIPFILIHFDKAKANKKEKPKTSRLLWFALLVITIFTIYLIDTLFIYYKTYSI